MASNSNEQSSDFSTTLKYLDALVDEALQVYELDNEKTNIVDELYHSLKIITDFLGFSIDITPDLLNLPANNRIFLTPSLDVLTIQQNGKTEQKKLKDFPFEKILNILEYAIPSMISQIRTERTSMNEKITFLRTAAKKLQHLRTINETHEISNSLLSVEGVKS